MVQPLVTTSTAVLNFEATSVPPSAEAKKITQLFSRNIRFLPIRRETIDALGRKMRLWEIPGADFLIFFSSYLNSKKDLGNKI